MRKKIMVSQDPLDALDREEACKHARELFTEIHAQSKIPDKSTWLPKFKWEAIITGNLLGKGGFGTVFEMRGLEVPATREEDQEGIEGSPPPTVLQISESEAFIGQNCLRETGEARYAIKLLNPEIVAKGKNTLMQAILDTATEARFLSGMEHPNIIKLRGISHHDKNRQTLFHEGIFLVLDRLYDTLEIRLGAWEAIYRKNNRTGIPGKLFSKLGRGRHKSATEALAFLWEERMSTAYDLSAALDYIHIRGIIHRDIKPENIGFDVRGDVKIFDFGLAREIPSLENIQEQVGDNYRRKEKPSMSPSNERSRSYEGLFKLTGCCGSPRYMAPEVGQSKLYNAKSDVYSFAILLWEILHLQIPYDEAKDINYLSERVWRGPMIRPPLNTHENGKSPWKSIKIRRMLPKAWSANLFERPSMAEITTILREEYVKARGGDSSDLDHNRRRSTHLFTRTKNSDRMEDFYEKSDHSDCPGQMEPTEVEDENSTEDDKIGRQSSVDMTISLRKMTGPFSRACSNDDTSLLCDIPFIQEQ